MFLENTKIGPSEIHGIGLFTVYSLGKGTQIYRHTPELDISLTAEEWNVLPHAEKEVFRHYGYVDLISGNWCLDHDDIRFINHSDTPNVGLDETGHIVALYTLSVGTELTQNYAEFDRRGKPLREQSQPQHSPSPSQPSPRHRPR